MTDINELIDAVSLKMCTDYGEAPDCVRHHRPVAKAAIEATMKWMVAPENISPDVVAAMWACVKPDVMPSMVAIFAAALSVHIKELEASHD